MKKFFVFVILTIVVISLCAAQTSTAEARKLVGTWVGTYDGANMTLVLNANGTGTLTFSLGNETESHNIFWGVSLNGGVNITSLGEMILYLSPDSRTMILADRNINIVLQKV